MKKPDRIGVSVLAFAVVALYISVANLLDWVGVASLPLGTVDSIPVMVINVIVVNLYVIRKGKHPHTKHTQ